MLYAFKVRIYTRVRIISYTFILCLYLYKYNNITIHNIIMIIIKIIYNIIRAYNFYINLNIIFVYRYRGI